MVRTSIFCCYKKKYKEKNIHNLGSDTSLTEDMIRDDLSDGGKSPDCSSSSLIGQYPKSWPLIGQYIVSWPLIGQYILSWPLIGQYIVSWPLIA